METAADREFASTVRAVLLFRGLDTAALEAVIAAARERKVPAGTYFFQQGDDARHLFVLRLGQVRVLQTTPDGNQVLLRFIKPGGMFGGVAAFGVREYPATAQATEDSIAWLWGAETMRELIRHSPQLALNALEHTAEIIQQLQDRVRELQTERLERRVARALLRLARQSGKTVPEGILIDHALSRQDLAEMTGTNLYSVSRILSAWEKQGLVSSGRERVTLCAPHKLVILAEDLIPPPAHE